MPGLEKILLYALEACERHDRPRDKGHDHVCRVSDHGEHRDGRESNLDVEATVASGREDRIQNNCENRGEYSEEIGYVA